MAKLIQEATEKIPEIRKNLRQEATYDETHTLRPKALLAMAAGN